MAAKYVFGGAHVLEDDVREELISKARDYEKDDLKVFIDEIGWEDWMNDFCSSEDEFAEPLENELENINRTLREVFELAQSQIEGEEIRKWRKNAKLSQAGMSKKMDIPKRTIEEWEAGRRTPPAYVERLVIKELMEITEKTIEDKLRKEMAKMPSDENGNRPVGSWAIIEVLSDGGEFIELFETMKEAIDEFNGEGYIGYIPCNQTEHGKEAWYTDKYYEVHSDHDGIEI